MNLEKERQLRELKELLEQPGWKHFQEIVKEEIVGACERWISGSEDIEASRGYIKGLKTSLKLADYKLNEWTQKTID